jgi:hypothetical protein
MNVDARDFQHYYLQRKNSCRKNLLTELVFNVESESNEEIRSAGITENPTINKV